MEVSSFTGWSNWSNWSNWSPTHLYNLGSSNKHVRRVLRQEEGMIMRGRERERERESERERGKKRERERVKWRGGRRERD